MNKLFHRYNISRQKVLTISGLLLLSLGLNNCSMPTFAESSQLVDSQLEAKIMQVIRKHPEVIMESVKEYQLKKQEEQKKAKTAFLQKMKVNPKSVIGSSPTTGASEQKIVLLIFSDFECFYCASVHKTLKEFMALHQGQVTLVYKHLPLTSKHPEAMSAAKASWAAGQQGKFWQFHDALYENQDKLSESFYIETAKALNLDIKQFNDNRNSSEATAAINKDVETASEIGINGTPTMAMNGEPLNGDVKLTDLEALLTQVSKQTKK